MKRLVSITFVMILPFFLSSCATHPVKRTSYPSRQVPSQKAVPGARQDVFHAVAPGETLWRIGKMYNVKPEEIARANGLANVEEVKIGQRLLIPQAESIKPIITLYPSEKWKYIIIHHSATHEGSALNFHKYHCSKGWDALGYHFVIDNGTDGKGDGQIEVSPRWTKQDDGAHCKAGNMNPRGIGICLVGNFSKEKISKKQLESLVYLVNLLKDRYKVSTRNILGHGQVKGAKTECPGKYFPWTEFRAQLNE